MLLRTIIGKAKILIVDDESANVRLLERILELIGCPPEQVRSTTDPTLAMGLMRDFSPDLVLLDLHMPDPDGFALLEQFKLISTAPGNGPDGGPGLPVPVLALTADVNPKTKHRALTAGARDFLTKPIDQPEVILRIKNLLENRFLHQELQDQNGRLETLVQERTGQLEETLTRLKEAQNNAIKHERLNALGTMAAGVAHDFNNALTLIHGYGELLLAATTKGRHGDPAPSPERPETKYVRTIMMAARDAANVVTRLRAFYRPDDGAEVRLEIHLGQLIDQAITMTAPRWLDEVRANGLTIHVRRDIETLPALQGDPAELREMFTNLIFNAVDALPAGGTITVRARTEDDGQAVRLEVADDGVGMSEETRRRCLEPFYTTKGEKGTGLGLSAVYGIIQRHGGSIDIESEPGRGTRFLIHLPVGPVRAEAGPRGGPENHPGHAAASSSNGPRNPARSLRILVVDDQPTVRSLLEEHLIQDGHHVCTAADGTEALAKFNADPCDLLLTDQAMPGMNGEALAAAIKEARPGTPVILLTGFGDMLRGKADERGDLQSPRDIDLILNKPVSVLELRRAIAQMSARPSGSQSGEPQMERG